MGDPISTSVDGVLGDLIGWSEGREVIACLSASYSEGRVISILARASSCLLALRQEQAYASIARARIAPPMPAPTPAATTTVLLDDVGSDDEVAIGTGEAFVGTDGVVVGVVMITIGLPVWL